MNAILKHTLGMEDEPGIEAVAELALEAIGAPGAMPKPVDPITLSAMFRAVGTRAHG